MQLELQGSAQYSLIMAKDIQLKNSLLRLLTNNEDFEEEGTTSNKLVKLLLDEMVKHLRNSILEIFKDQNLLKGSLPRALRQIAGRVLDLGKNFEIYQNFETGSEDSSFFD